MPQEEEPELITLKQASKRTGVPIDALKKAVHAKTTDKHLWSVLKETPFGPVRYTTPEAADQYSKSYRPHVKKS